MRAKELQECLRAPTVCGLQHEATHEGTTATITTSVWRHRRTIKQKMTSWTLQKTAGPISRRHSKGIKNKKGGNFPLNLRLGGSNTNIGNYSSGDCDFQDVFYSSVSFNVCGEALNGAQAADRKPSLIHFSLLLSCSAQRTIKLLGGGRGGDTRITIGLR